MNETTERFKGVLRRLLEKSRKGEVIWEAVGKEQPPEGFRVSIDDPDVTILVKWHSPTAEPDFAQAELFVKGSRVTLLFAEDGGNADDYQLLRDLWQDAHRCVYGWDQALEKLESVLQSEGTVGTPF